MATRRVLVTGPTGDSGGFVARQLIERGHFVRALVHREDDRSEALKQLGAEIVVGDLNSLDDLRAALIGVRQAYYCYPIVPGIIASTAYFAQAAVEANIESVVNMSQISSRRDSKSHAARDHWIAERVFDWSGLNVAHVRPTFFAEWMIYLSPVIKAHNLMITPLGNDNKHAPVAAEDQARVIVGILENPEEHKGKIYPLYGSKNLTQDEIVAAISSVLGRTITHQQVDAGEWAATLQAGATNVRAGESSRTLYGAMRSQPGDPEHFLVQHLREVAIDHSNGLFAGENDVMTRIGGQPALGVEEFIEANRPAFG
jgi:uncharacterized protein YbjT (DUF2867 family)